MIQLQVISGKQAGSDIVARRFPFVIGRGADAHLKLEDQGVWDRHAEITYDRRNGFHLKTRSDATVLVNRERVSDARLRNGDTLELGSARVRFWLARSEQKTMRVREALTWTSLIGLFGAQIWLIYALLR